MKETIKHIVLLAQKAGTLLKPVWWNRVALVLWGETTCGWMKKDVLLIMRDDLVHNQHCTSRKLERYCESRPVGRECAPFMVSGASWAFAVSLSWMHIIIRCPVIHTLPEVHNKTTRRTWYNQYHMESRTGSHSYSSATITQDYIHIATDSLSSIKLGNNRCTQRSTVTMFKETSSKFFEYYP